MTQTQDTRSSRELVRIILSADTDTDTDTPLTRTRTQATPLTKYDVVEQLNTLVLTTYELTIEPLKPRSLDLHFYNLLTHTTYYTHIYTCT